ncbi:MAG: ABC transporter permease subunit [Clostridiales bacterium]|jgi:putative aldouronate transport system permease protein|nr:ABC transporter permease subunit [Clostridiales bacterium]
MIFRGTKRPDGAAAVPKADVKPKAGLSRHLKSEWQLYALLVIPMAFLILFKYVPMFGLVGAFENYKVARGFFGSEWVGLKEFGNLLKHRDFLPALRNTLLLNFLDLLFGFPMPIILALLLNEIRSKWFKRVTQTLLYLPHFLSWVIIGALAYQLFGLNSGIVNNLLESAGLSRIPFLQENTRWLATYVAVGVWQSMGWGIIVYLAAISGINPELYEAATVDGAGRFRQALCVTLPGIRSTIVVLLILNLGRIMGGSFERIYAMQNVATTEYTMTIPVLIYRWGILGTQFSRAIALGLFQSVVGLILVLITDRVAKRLGEGGML